jgi:hypothetical protein
MALGGCAGADLGHAIDQLRAPDPKEGPVYLEQIDNDAFLDFVLDNNIIEGLRRDDVIYADNIYGAVRFGSSKVILAKDAFYSFAITRVGLWPNYKVDIDRLRKTYHSWLARYHSILIYKRYYVTPEYVYKVEIRPEDSFFYDYCKQSVYYNSCEALSLIEERRGEAKWYQKKRIYNWRHIPHRYNDIYKIKAVIDERVAYFLSLENNQTNTTSADQ